MDFNPFFNFRTIENHHVFSWLIGTDRVDPQALYDQALQQATKECDELTTEEKDDDFDRAKFIEHKIDEYLPDIIRELIQERLGDFREGGCFADVMEPGIKCDSTDDSEFLIGGLVTCAMDTVSFEVLASAIKLYVMNETLAEVA